MKNYAISEMNGSIYVIDRDTGTTIGGPYSDTEKETANAKAKRRIRDLKRKDAAAPAEPVKALNDRLSTVAETLNADIMGSIDDGVYTGDPRLATPIPAEPGRLGQTDATFGNYPPERQRGCYPHISKRAYRR